jgi:hypothetical protein
LSLAANRFFGHGVVFGEGRPAMIDYKSALTAILQDPRYQRNLDWGQPRPGHPEGTVRAHVAELEGNLEAIRGRLAETDYWKLKLLIHTHDTFKADAKPNVPIADPASHASLARAFLAEYRDDSDLLAIVQYHDEPYALWHQFKNRGTYNSDRLAVLLNAIQDWDLFLAFNIIDGCTAGKSREPLRWFFGELCGKVASRFTAEDIL